MGKVLDFHCSYVETTDWGASGYTEVDLWLEFIPHDPKSKVNGGKVLIF